MVLFLGGFLALVTPLLLQQGLVYDQARTQFNEAMSTAAADGLPGLIGKLDSIAKAFPSSSFTPYIQETIHAIAVLHPGSVQDQPARLQSLKASAAANPALAQVARRIELFQAYYRSAARGQSESAAASLSDPAIAGSLLGTQAQADAALRARDYPRAEALALRLIEHDPSSPLLANAYMVLGLSASYRGEARAGLTQFRNALAVTPLPTVYGDTRLFLFTAFRFARFVPGAAGELFDEATAVRLAAPATLKDPQSLLPSERGFFLVDREQTLTLTLEGKVLDTRAARKIEDAAVGGAAKMMLLAEDGIDLGNGSFVPLTLSVEGRPRPVKKLRSLAPDPRGDIFLLDQDFGLLRAVPAAAGSPAVTALGQVKGRLLRIDRRGNVYILAADGKSIVIVDRQGKPLTSVVPAATAGKESNIAYFALDSLDHLYVLDANSIQVYAMIDRSAGLDKVQVGTLPLDARPQFKNLRVIAVGPAGEIVVTGKNDDNWVCYK